ncbi:hypothetical protein DL768_009053 [Monosporascus sp. mg162]|nr:hypothetical protein DL768_009053 [Monosporascus sp. mg162]
MRSKKQAALPVESSWRMVEGGENDSFDTSIVQDPYEDDPIISSGPSQISSSSQGLSDASQDSISNIAYRADDERLITRVPFQPSLASARHASADKEKTPVQELLYPTLDAESPSHSSAHSSRTVRPPAEGPQQPIRRRAYNGQTTNLNPQMRSAAARQRPEGYEPDVPGQRQRPTPSERFTSAAPEALFDIVAWCLSILGMALQYAKWPLALLLAVYITVGTGMIFKNMVTESISTTLSPLCRIPGASFVDLPFCPKFPPGPDDGTQVEFDGLMAAQSNFEKVLEDSAAGVSLPMEMKRSEASVRDLRTMVKFSELPNRIELVGEFDQYIETIRQTADDLQIFNTHVGSAVDSVISINRWTSRFIDSVAASREANDNLLVRWSGWLWTPFQPVVFDEQFLLEKYVEHTALVSDKIAGLILEAQAALRQLRQAEGHLQLIHEHVQRGRNEASAEHAEVLWTLWTLVGGNNRRLHNLGAQLQLLRQIELQRGAAVAQLVGLVHDLGDIQSKLSDLRDRVAAPELTGVGGGSGSGRGGRGGGTPLVVHIETINAGVERLEAARSRIRAEENERLQQALVRARGESRMIEG